MAEVARSLAPSADAASRARRALDELDGSLLSDHVREDLELLVSELVTNAVRHAGASEQDSIELSVRVDAGRVRVEVTDPGPGFEPSTSAPTMFQGSGWGLYLVAQISDRWGVEPGPGGTVVWLEIDFA
jgi:anti-sigma regulatory factor (Ser/Thr protein kinase)